MRGSSYNCKTITVTAWLKMTELNPIHLSNFCIICLHCVFVMGMLMLGAYWVMSSHSRLVTQKTYLVVLILSVNKYKSIKITNAVFQMLLHQFAEGVILKYLGHPCFPTELMIQERENC